jgi:hypothetical protein
MARIDQGFGSHADLRKRAGYPDRRGEEGAPTKHRRPPVEPGLSYTRGAVSSHDIEPHIDRTSHVAPSNQTMHMHPKGGIAPRVGRSSGRQGRPSAIIPSPQGRGECAIVPTEASEVGRKR